MAPAWFDYRVYFNNKLTEWQREDPEAGRTRSDLINTFAENGYDANDPDSMYQHFVDYGNAENVSPNAYFDTYYYFTSKAAQYYGKDFDAVTKTDVIAMEDAFKAAGLSAWDHYIQYGTAEGINPSEYFDTVKYLDAKLAVTPGLTMDELLDALKDGGLNPIMHYELYGASEGIEPSDFEPDTPGPEPPGPEPVDASYTNADDYATQYVWSDDRGEIDAAATDTRFVALENQLTSQQVFKGSEGHDMLDITLGASSTKGNIVAPLADGVEDVRIKALQHNDTNNGDNLPGINNEAQIDAGDIKGMTRLWSSNSRADVIVEDVRTDSTDLTNVFQSADPGDVDFEVYFDPQHLKSVVNVSTEGTLFVNLIDCRGYQEEGQPLLNNPWQYFAFEFTPNGGESKIVTLDLAATGKLITGKGATYGTLLSAFQTALVNAGYGNLITASLGEDFDADATITRYGESNTYYGTGTQIVLNTTAGAIAVEENGDAIPGTGWLTEDGSVPAIGGIVWDAYGEYETSGCPLIQTNIWLDNVARVNWTDLETGIGENCLPDDIIYGSQAGDLIIGSMAGRGGVERFDITVDRGSWLSSLSSTNQTLRLVTAVNGDVINDEDGNNASDNGKGNLFIGHSLVDAPSYDELNLWADPAKFLSTDGLIDVAVFDAETFKGDINLGASITRASYEKYLKGVDGSHPIDRWAPLSGYDTAFSYLLGDGNDTLNMKVDGSIANDNDFQMIIDGGAGNDLFLFTFDFDSDVIYGQGREGGFFRQDINAEAINNEIANQLVKFKDNGEVVGTDKYVAIADLANVEINGGAGDDIVHLNGWGSVVVDGGEGRDVIYNEDYTGAEDDVQGGVLARGIWLVNAYQDDPRGTHTYDEASRAILVNYVDGAQPVANSALSTYNEVNDISDLGYGEVRLRVEYQDVHSAWVTIKASDLDSAQLDDKKKVIDTLYDSDINALIIQAINDDAYGNMNHLLHAKDGAGYSLIIESLIGGNNAEEAPVIVFQGRTDAKANWASLSFDNIADYDAQLATIDGSEITLVDGAAVSNNIIWGGAGDDLIVLGTNVGESESSSESEQSDDEAVADDKAVADDVESEETVDESEGSSEGGVEPTAMETGSHDIVAFDEGFGKDIILNFVVGEGDWQTEPGEDLLDFTAFFEDEKDFQGFTANENGFIEFLEKTANAVAYDIYDNISGKKAGLDNSVVLTQFDKDGNWINHAIDGVDRAACFDVYSSANEGDAYTYQGTIALIGPDGVSITDAEDILYVDVVTGYYGA